jgi:hypothetical protein
MVRRACVCECRRRLTCSFLQARATALKVDATVAEGRDLVAEIRMHASTVGNPAILLVIARKEAEAEAGVQGEATGEATGQKGEADARSCHKKNWISSLRTTGRRMEKEMGHPKTKKLTTRMTKMQHECE